MTEILRGTTRRRFLQVGASAPVAIGLASTSTMA